MRKSQHLKETKANIIYVTPGQGHSAQQSARSTRTKRKPNLRTLFLILFSLWALYTFFFVLMPNKARLDKEQQQLEQHLSEIRQQEQQLSTQLNNLQDDSYIARLARKYYNMIRQGEILYRPGE